MKHLRLLPAISLLAAATAFAADNPAYNNSMLTIPRIDSANQVGLYQDVLLQYSAGGNLKVVQIEELGKGKVYSPGSVLSAEVVQSGTLPVSVYLRVSGGLGCATPTSPARIHQRLQGTRFDVNITAQHAAPLPPEPVPCTTQFVPYTVTVPLEVYGLAAGTYTYTINGVLSGSFTLTANNRFGNDCDVMKNGNC